MNRIKDYTNFAAWYVGLGYVVLWPVTSNGIGGKPFGAAILCDESARALVNLLCASARPLQMPLGLHALGFLSSVFVTIRLIHFAIRRSRRRPGVTVPISFEPPGQPLAAPVPPPRRRKPAPPVRPVKPRNQFGLRGLPR